MRRFAAARADKRRRGRDNLIIQAHHPALDVRTLEVLPVQVALRIVEQSFDAAVLPRDAGDGESGALPELVMVDLRDGRPEPLRELGLHRLYELALPLQRAVLGEMQLGREDPDIAGAHAGIEADYDAVVVGAGCSLRSVLSTCRVS